MSWVDDCYSVCGREPKPTILVLAACRLVASLALGCSHAVSNAVRHARQWMNFSLIEVQQGLFGDAEDTSIAGHPEVPLIFQYLVDYVLDKAITRSVGMKAATGIAGETSLSAQPQISRGILKDGVNGIMSQSLLDSITRELPIVIAAQAVICPHPDIAGAILVN